MTFHKFHRVFQAWQVWFGSKPDWFELKEKPNPLKRLINKQFTIIDKQSQAINAWLVASLKNIAGKIPNSNSLIGAWPTGMVQA